MCKLFFIYLLQIGIVSNISFAEYTYDFTNLGGKSSKYDINVAINNIAYGLSKNITLSFIITLFVTALIGFIGQKYWVFRN